MIAADHLAEAARLAKEADEEADKTGSFDRPDYERVAQLSMRSQNHALIAQVIYLYDLGVELMR